VRPKNVRKNSKKKDCHAPEGILSEGLSIQ